MPDSPTPAPLGPILSTETVDVAFEDGIAWVTLNRPAKRNAMSPSLNSSMCRILDALETDDRCGVVVLTGAGDAFSAGMDLKEFFRETEGVPHVERMRVYRAGQAWQWRQLLHFYKPTIAMVNGWCFGGAFTPLIACDLAIAAEEATFGVSEINWGIIPGGNVSKALSTVMPARHALYYVMTGETFDGRRAAELGVVNSAVPLAMLRETTARLAKTLLGKNSTVLRQAKIAHKMAADMTWDQAADYLTAKNEQAALIDPERGRERGMTQFLDERSFKPGLGAYRRP